MKRRVGKNVVNACVAGLMVGAVGVVAPDSAIADASASGEARVEAQESINAALYGPPSAFESDGAIDSDELVQALYGPPVTPVVDEDIQDLYGPPVAPVTEEPIEVLYGPPPEFFLQENPMEVRVSDKTVRVAKVTARKKLFKHAIVVKKAVGAVRYARISKSSSKQLRINSRTGVVTLAKGSAKGVYKLKVKVYAAGNDEYASASKTVTVKVRVK